MANIASLYDVSRKYPDAFKQNTVNKALKRYKSEILLSQKYVDKAQHLHVYYEELVKKPEIVLKRIFGFLSLKYDESILRFNENADKVILQAELWKENNRNQLELKNKIHERLSDEEIRFLNKELSSFHPKLLSYYERN
jgi:hypothetical protein